MVLPGCMIGPSEPCEAFTALQGERDRLRVEAEGWRRYARKAEAALADETRMTEKYKADCQSAVLRHDRQFERAEKAERAVADVQQQLATMDYLIDRTERAEGWRRYAIDEIERLSVERKAAISSAEKAEAVLKKVISHYQYGINPFLDAAVVEARAILGDKLMTVGEFNARADAGEAWLRSRGFRDVP